MIFSLGSRVQVLQRTQITVTSHQCIANKLIVALLRLGYRECVLIH